MADRVWTNDSGLALSAANLNAMEDDIKSKVDKTIITLNLKDFPWRAVGDGVADDTAAVQAFFNYLADTGGAGTGVGKFRLTTSILKTTPAKPFSFIGAGATRTEFLFDMPLPAPGTDPKAAFYFTNMSDCMFADFAITGNTSPQLGHGMSMANCQDTTVHGVTITNWSLTAIMFYYGATYPTASMRNRIVSCTARSLDGKARNGFMHENSKNSSMVDCKVYNLDPYGDPSYALQLKNGCIGCSILGGSVDGAAAGVAFGNTINQQGYGNIVDNVTVRNCVSGFIGSYNTGARVSMAVDMADNAVCVNGVYIAAESYYGVYNVSVLNIPDTGTAVTFKQVGNTVNLEMNKVGASQVAQFMSAAQYNTLNVIGIGGLSDLGVLTASISDASGNLTNKAILPGLAALYALPGNTSSLLRFASATNSNTWIQYRHDQSQYIFRSVGTDVMTLSATQLTPSANNTIALGSSIRAWSSVYAHKHYFGLTGIYQSTGTGSPEGVVTAPVGSEYINTAGVAGAIKYAKKSGTGNTGWIAIW